MLPWIQWDHLQVSPVDEKQLFEWTQVNICEKMKVAQFPGLSSFFCVHQRVYSVSCWNIVHFVVISGRFWHQYFIVMAFSLQQRNTVQFNLPKSGENATRQEANNSVRQPGKKPIPPPKPKPNGRAPTTNGENLNEIPEDQQPPVVPPRRIRNEFMPKASDQPPARMTNGIPITPKVTVRFQMLWKMILYWGNCGWH